MKNRAADYAKLSVEFLRVVASLPKYLRLYFCLITDNRVSSKAKVLLVTAIGVLGAQFAFGGWAFRVQTWVTKKFGPIGFMPSLMIVLGTLDLCYKLIDADVLEGYEKEIFGEGNTVQRDIALVVGFFGSRYDGLKAWWQKKADNVEVQMAGEGLIVNGEMTDEAIQDVALGRPSNTHPESTTLQAFSHPCFSSARTSGVMPWEPHGSTPALNVATKATW
jgi:hypothetical protein